MHDRQVSRPHLRSIRGSALITVTLIGLFIMLVAAALVNNYATGEARAIADSLAKTRIYWASMGHINFALSRIQREGLCGALTCDNLDDDGTPAPTDFTNRADNLRLYLADLNNDTDGRIWDFGDGYSFKLSASVTESPAPVDPNDGRLRTTISLQPVAGTPYDALNGIEQRIRGDLIADVCLSAPCGADNDTTNGASLIEAVRRQ